MATLLAVRIEQNKHSLFPMSCQYRTNLLSIQRPHPKMSHPVIAQNRQPYNMRCLPAIMLMLLTRPDRPEETIITVFHAIYYIYFYMCIMEYIDGIVGNALNPTRWDMFAPSHYKEAEFEKRHFFLKSHAIISIFILIIVHFWCVLCDGYCR